MRSRFRSLLVPVFMLALVLTACGDSFPTEAINQPVVTPKPNPTTVTLPSFLSTPTVKVIQYLPPYGCLPAITIKEVVVQACMDKPNPTQNDTLQLTTRMSVDGAALVNAPVKTTWNYKTGKQQCITTSDKDGVGFCYQKIGKAEVGFRVVVEIQYDWQGKGHRAETSFTPAVEVIDPWNFEPAQENPIPTAIPAPRPTVKAPVDPVSELSRKGQLTYETPNCKIKGNVGFDTGEKIYHVPGGKYYAATVINLNYDERWFCTEQDAINNGWRRSQY